MKIVNVLVIIMAVCVLCQCVYIRKLVKNIVKAKSTNNTKSRILAMIAHDIRTPLNSIMGNVELAKVHAEDFEQQEYLRRIKLSGENLMTIVDEMMEYDEIENGKASVVSGTVNIDSMMSKIETSVKLQGMHKRQKIDISAEKLEYSNVITDGAKLYRICQNLMTNAIKYTENDGNVQMRIWEEKEASDEMFLCIRVKDTGIGMTEEFMANMYNLYERNGKSSESGYGLGLYIVKHMVELLKGTIECKSVVGMGTEFTVKIPVTPKEVAEEENKKQERDGLKGMRVLIADDVRANREIVSEYLSMYGIECDCAENGSRCVEMVDNGEEVKYHAVLMDVNMPGLNGIDATKHIREKNDVPVIAISGDSDPMSVRRCDEAGMNKCIQKPVDFKILLGVLKDIYCKDTH